MFYTRFAALFAHYCAVHLTAAGRTIPLVGDTGQMLGHIDRVCLQGPRLIIEGWADSDQIVVAHAGLRHTATPALARPDVLAAHPHLLAPSPGFSVNLPRGDGPVTFSLMQGSDRLVFQVPQPDPSTLRHAQMRLIWPFVRDLTRGVPAFLHWLATKDPADRTRLKRALRLEIPLSTRQMQPLLFLADCLATLPTKRHPAELARLQPAPLAQTGITIVLPVFNALDLLPEVLHRIAHHTDVPWRLILIEDASSDPALSPFLRGWVHDQKALHQNRILLIENAENQGFIRSVNTGLMRAIEYGDHVVLLNSDAFVPQAWASRLMRPILHHDRVATVTPMSNNAEIFSTPVICQAGILQPGDGDAIDAVAAKIHPDAGLAEAPTGVGFCMAMSIEFLRRIPQLDPAFGRGYGEEVDWCQKARALGGRHLGLANLFVEHRGGTSFGSAEKRRLVARNNAIISQRYRGYDADVQRFIADDPLVASRLALAIAWSARQAKGPIALFLAHNLGGGADDYLTQRIAEALPNCALVLRVGTKFRWQLELHTPDGITKGGTDDFALIRRMLDPVDQLRIVYSCGVGGRDPITLPERLAALRRGPSDQIEVLLHDYLTISPSYTLLNSKGRYMGVPDGASVDAAHCVRGSGPGKMTLSDWRKSWGRLIEQADDIVCFSDNSAQLFLTAYPSAKHKLRVQPHKMLVDVRCLANKPHGAAVVIGVLGNIGVQKGAGVLQDLSHRLAAVKGAKLIVLGRVDPTYPLGATAHIHGGYLRPEIPALVARYGITDWLIPSIWPETFSYTTHEAIATGLPVWGFDLGAQADAIRNTKRGGVIAIPDGVPDLGALFDALLQPTLSFESAAA